MTEPNTTDQRIERFRKLVQMDPEDATSHFTLGTAYAEAQQHQEAAEAFLNAISIDKGFSKAFQLAGRSLIATGQRERAVRVLEQGHQVANRQGDLMPMKAIEEMLHELGEPIGDPSITPSVGGNPEPASAGTQQPGSFIDTKTGAPGTRLARPPFKGPVGQWIYERISAESWQRWLGEGTKIINELRLDLSSDQGSNVYDFAMLLYVGIDGHTYRQLTSNEPPQVPADYQEMIGRIMQADPETLASFKGQVEEIHRSDG